MLKHYREDKPARDNQPTKIESEQESDSGIPRVLFFELLAAPYFRDRLIDSLPF